MLMKKSLVILSLLLIASVVPCENSAGMKEGKSNPVSREGEITVVLGTNSSSLHSDGLGYGTSTYMSSEHVMYWFLTLFGVLILGLLIRSASGLYDSSEDYSYEPVPEGVYP
jgi:hypothetical protein